MPRSVPLRAPERVTGRAPGRRRSAVVTSIATAALVAAGLAAPAAAEPEAAPSDGPVEAAITVPKVEGMGEDWINGADFSSILSLEESGVTFENFEGEEADLFDVLADAGVNWARIRVWNQPYREADPSQGYGAGNVDVDRATIIGKRATEAGMRVLVNFHYSDFWAHPGQQYVPRAWAGTTHAERVQALYDYTVESLTTMKNAGVDIGMVQIGNETTSGEIAGTRGWASTADLFDAGSRAVRDTLGDDVKVAVHFTNPERVGQYATVARELDQRGVDYDVFLSSYYAFWHGTPANLTTVLSQIATTYDKEVAVAETSWTYTLEDGDGTPNSVRTANAAYSATPQGQALAVRDVMQAVADVPDGKGIGTFYWEPAWLPVGPPSQFDENFELWQRDGSGWASTYAQDFYKPATGWYEGMPESEWADVYGGSGWDNQALFDFTGKPLESLRVYEYAKTGSVAPRELESVSSPRVSVVDGDAIVLPGSVEVAYNDGTTEQQDVVWSDDVAWISGPGTYTVRGTTSAGHAAQATVVVRGSENEGTNLVVNPGFESGVAPWVGTGTGYTISRAENPFAGSRSTHFWSGSAYSFSIEQRIEGVAPGRYVLSAKAQGGGAGASDSMSISAQSGIATETAAFTLQGHNAWQTPTTAPLNVAADGVVVIRADLSLSAGAWGSLDEFSLVAVPDEVAVDTSALTALVERAEGLDRAAYTAESLAAVDAALVRSSFVLGSASASQASVDGAAAALEAALDALVEAPVAPAELTVSASTVTAGETVDVTVTGLGSALESVEIGIESTYQALADVAVVDGVAAATVTIPATLEAGVHTLQARDAEGVVLAAAEITVEAAAPPVTEEPTDGEPTDGGPTDGGPTDGGPTTGGPTAGGPGAGAPSSSAGTGAQGSLSDTGVGTTALVASALLLAAGAGVLVLRRRRGAAL